MSYQDFELLLTVRLHGGGTAEEAARAFTDSAGLVLEELASDREIEVVAAQPCWTEEPPAPTSVSAETLLRGAGDALRDISLRLLAVKPWLDKPYTDRPELTPWTRTIERRARFAHHLSVQIRKFLAPEDPRL
jgi:hypothetical protein